MPIELYDVCIARSHLQVHFRAAEISECLFNMFHERPADSFASRVGVCRKIVHPASMSVEARHDAARECSFFIYCNDKKFRLHGKFSRDVLSWIIPWACEPCEFPKSNDGIDVCGTEGPDAH